MNDVKKILDLSVLAGEILLKNGAEIFRVHDTMTIIAKTYKAYNFNAFIISNGIFASISNNIENHYTEVKHIPLSPVHLGRVTAVNSLSREIAEGKYTIEEAMQELEKISQIPYAPNTLQIFCSGIGSGCFCFLLGGSFYDSFVSFILGIMLYIFLTAIASKKVSKITVNILGSGLVTILGLLMFNLGMGDNIGKIITGAIIPLVPGVPLTNSIRDYLNGDYLSGTIRLIDALLIAFCIALGVGVVLKFGNLIGGII